MASVKPTHAAIPGTGPSGETCFTCGHAATAHPMRGKPFPACLKVADMTKRSPADCGQVRPSDRACRHWKPRAS